MTASGYEDLAHGVDWILAQFWYPAIGAVAISGGWHHPAAYPFSMEFTIVADGGTLEFNSAGKRALPNTARMAGNTRSKCPPRMATAPNSNTSWTAPRAAKNRSHARPKNPPRR